jgi:hypothetical protein
MSDIGDRLPDESRASNLDSLGHYLSHRPRFIHLLRTRRRPFRNAPHGSPSPLLPWLPTLKSAARERERFSSPVFPYIHLAWASTPRRSELERAGGSRGGGRGEGRARQRSRTLSRLRRDGLSPPHPPRPRSRSRACRTTHLGHYSRELKNPCARSGGDSKELAGAGGGGARRTRLALLFRSFEKENNRTAVRAVRGARRADRKK